MTRELGFARRALVAAGAVLAALGLTATAALADDWGQRAAGQHVYDRAGVLTPAQVTDLEAAAARVDQAGAPTIVYLRLKDANQAAATLDARDLMDVWSVESAAGAKDGFVLLLDLRPDDPRHGSAALVAGQHHAVSGQLTDARLQEIFDGPMRPHLATGDLAGALSVALTDVADDLTTAPPSNVPQQQQSSSPESVAGALLGLGALVAVALGIVVLLARTYRGGGGFSTNRTRGGQPWYPNDYDAGSSTNSGGFTGGGGDGGASSGSSSGGGSF